MQDVKKCVFYEHPNLNHLNYFCNYFTGIIESGKLLENKFKAYKEDHDGEHSY